VKQRKQASQHRGDTHAESALGRLRKGDRFRRNETIATAYGTEQGPFPPKSGLENVKTVERCRGPAASSTDLQQSHHVGRGQDLVDLG